MVVHPSGHLHMFTEYSCEAFTLAAGPDAVWRGLAATAASPIAQLGVDFPAELAHIRDGQFLYTALRGNNTISALRMRGSGGRRVGCARRAQRGLATVPPRARGKILVAVQCSDTIALLDFDERTSAPRGIRLETPAPTPAHLLLMR